MRRSLLALHGIGLVLALLPPAASAPPPKPAASRKTFLGHVLSVDRSNRWFVMKGGSSKRYPQVKMLLDKQTRWSGATGGSKTVRPGEAVRAEGTLVQGTTFRALSVTVQAPMSPSARGASKMQRR